MRPLAVAAALLLYGLLSAPAPPAPGMVEAVVGGLLLVAAGWHRPLAVACGAALLRPRPALWEAAGVLAFAALLWPPLLRGLAQGWDLRQVARDVVPLLFLFLPVVLVPLLRPAGAAAVRWLAGGLAAAGVLFTVRWWDEMGWGFGAVGTRAMPEGAHYVLNAPSVLFAAILLPAVATGWLVRGGMLRRLAAPVLLAGGALCLAALAGAVHRMALGLAAVALWGVMLWWGRRAPWTVGGLLAVAAGLAWGLDGPVFGAIDQVVEKSRSAGLNARGAEAVAVLERVADDPVALLVGEGWGALLANPAVGGWRVAYTHTLVSYTLFKAGLLGLLGLLAWLIGLVPAARRLLRTDPILAAAILPPLAVSLGLHTSFKYLDCGLLVTLMILSSSKDDPSGHLE
ncbi:hypothetical protein [Azospirillum halopraeferens]|uniref:hypothetical protein n=1 Tax=Azospirillum halopraeferens TaxID=34010 RepID=UPI00040B993E|nr:hypothetical protein [Azospirillum halopraeferens]